MHKKLALYACVLLCLIGANSVRAQSIFYDNSEDHFFYSPVGLEIAMPIAFSGSYEVDSFTFGFYLPPDALNGPTTDAIIRFYQAGPSGGAFDDGTLVAATRLTNLSSTFDVTSVVTDDLTTFGDFFQWNATELASGETGGWMSIEFTNPDAGWELATGDSQDDFYQDMTDGTYYDFGGDPQAAFYVQLSGQIITAPVPVPEAGVTALLAGLLAPGSLVYLRRRRGVAIRQVGNASCL